MKFNKTFLVLALLALSACKTQEDIRREKSLENINEKISQTQQLSANANARFLSLEEQMTKLNGSVEELAHNKGSDQKEVLLLKDRVNQLEEANKKQAENIKILADKVNEQTHYIEQVIKSLSDLSESKESPKKKSEKENKDGKDAKEAKAEQGNDLKAALDLYKEKKYDETKNLLENLLENSKMKKKDKATAVYYLGLVNFKTKKYDDAKIYFSRLFTEFPDSSYSAGALLNLAKTFTQLKAKDEAKQTLDELITRFPKSKEGIEAAKLKAKL